MRGILRGEDVAEMVAVKLLAPMLGCSRKLSSSPRSHRLRLVPAEGERGMRAGIAAAYSPDPNTLRKLWVAPL